jgi:hypothetical protein
MGSGIFLSVEVSQLMLTAYNISMYLLRDNYVKLDGERDTSE